MSDSPLGPGWWQASDNKWYSPEVVPGSPNHPSRPGAAHPHSDDLGPIEHESRQQYLERIKSTRLAAASNPPKPSKQMPAGRGLCPICQKRVTSLAVICQHCGARLESTARAEDRSANNNAGVVGYVLCLGLFLALLAIGAIGQACDSHPPASSRIGGVVLVHPIGR
jgi:hypothetical protein